MALLVQLFTVLMKKRFFIMYQDHFHVASSRLFKVANFLKILRFSGTCKTKKFYSSLHYENVLISPMTFWYNGRIK